MKKKVTDSKTDVYAKRNIKNLYYKKNAWLSVNALDFYLPGMK
jgi:hypothetical protein